MINQNREALGCKAIGLARLLTFVCLDLKALLPDTASLMLSATASIPPHTVSL